MIATAVSCVPWYFLAAHVGSCVLPSEAMMVQRHGDSLYAVKTVSVFTVYWDDARVLCTLCPRAVHVVYVSGPRESLALCHMHFFLAYSR